MFRARFPKATWLLVDTSVEEANLRISQREGHFYKVVSTASPSSSSLSTTTINTSITEDTEKTKSLSQSDDVDNSEWKFDKVDYPHIVLDGNAAIKTNAQRVVDVIHEIC